MQLSICIITKNEQTNLPHCLRCLVPYNVEIIVVDTGSTDSTKQIAQQYTDKVYDFVWCDDFAAAKNFAVSKASNPYVMIIDSDEYLEELDIDTLYEQIKQHPDQVGRIHRKNIFHRKNQRQENLEWINRIFHKEKFHYEGRIHEQVTAISEEDYDTYLTSVVISHSGYDLPEEGRKKKAKRNIVLLEKELLRLQREHMDAGRSDSLLMDTVSGLPCMVLENVEENAKQQIPYILYQLGKSYYMSEDYITACDYFSQGLSYDLNPKLEYVIDMVETYGYALLNSNQAETALFFENIYHEFGNSADFQFLMGLIYMNNGCFDDAIEEFKKAAAHKECRNAGVNSYAAYYNMGVIYECLGNLERAREYYAKCGEYEPAKTRLAERMN